ncbi:hypothetical protein [Nocardiopsis deserti]|uniref:hypothetical protein n=1 Tax=Nocardiopsis deserti TaxID=2605988 RepID=UPI001238EEF8|nr:hypothetical protein [Nocardiopsis deserti]
MDDFEIWDRSLIQGRRKQEARRLNAEEPLPLTLGQGLTRADVRTLAPEHYEGLRARVTEHEPLRSVHLICRVFMSRAQR